ncbi:MAG: carboxymuconolactone decarboxylase family protein [Deltaproteobacteria bacterium]|nr:carboxymuconolactone decarboxylase family protein [Deltaproteobacteria bacterium]
MKTLTLAFILSLSSLAVADTKPQLNPAAAAAKKEIEKAFGFVPGFVHAMPQALLPSWWEATKALSMNPSTALDGKTKELIGLAVAAATPCEYCVLFHTEAARLNGANDQEIAEAVGIASLTKQGSTLLNGLLIDKAQFKKDVERIIKIARAQMKK